jgi:hypothetical protein
LEVTELFFIVVLNDPEKIVAYLSGYLFVLIVGSYQLFEFTIESARAARFLVPAEEEIDQDGEEDGF